MAKRPQQTKLFISNLETRFGGSLLKGNPKKKRDLTNKSNIHLVLRSTKATGDWSLLKYAKEIDKIIRTKASQNYILIRRIANSGDHLHIVLYIQNKYTWAPFIREISNNIMKLVTGASRFEPMIRDLNDKTLSSKKSVFWSARPFTRIISASKDLWTTVRYLQLNEIEILTGLKRSAARFLLTKIEGPLQLTS